MNATELPLGDAAPARRRWSLSRSIILTGAVLLLFAWIATGVFLKVEYAEGINSATRENLNLARALQETTVRVLATADQATRRMSTAVASGDYTLDQLVQFANETGLVPNILVQLSLVGPDGRFMGSNLDIDGSRTGHVDLSEREHIRAHLRPNAVDAAAQGLFADGLFIGKPVLGKVSGRWTIQLSRRIDDAKGKPLGVVVASLDPSYFESVYRSVNLGPDGAVTLLGQDLTVRARVKDGVGGNMGAKLSGITPLSRRAATEAGSYVTGQGLDGLDEVERVSVYHRVKGYPLYVVVASTTQQALDDWRVITTMLLGVMGLLTLAVSLALYAFVTSVRRLEVSNRDLAASEARAQSANQAKTEFLAAISHELRTPLTSIRGFAELMETRIEQPRFREQAGLIRRSAEHLNVLLTEILDLAKVEAGAVSIRMAPVNLRSMMEGVREFFAVTAVEKGLALKLDVADDLPEWIMGDDLRLKQVLNNLLSNALKFTAAGSVTLAMDRQADQLMVHVIDTGPGIPEHLHELIFERFRQADARVSSEHGGTGLGLALARALTEMMGGKLSVHSSPGAGSRFTMSLLLVPATPEGVEA